MSQVIIDYLRSEIDKIQSVMEEEIHIEVGAGPHDSTYLEEEKSHFDRKVKGFNQLAEGITEEDQDTS